MPTDPGWSSAVTQRDVNRHEATREGRPEREWRPGVGPVVDGAQVPVRNSIMIGRWSEARIAESVFTTSQASIRPADEAGAKT